MKVIDLINDKNSRPFSFEVLPPLKGNGTDALFNTIDCLKEFDPRYINITTHRSEFVYKDLGGGLMQRQRFAGAPAPLPLQLLSSNAMEYLSFRTSYAAVTLARIWNTCSWTFSS